MEKDTDNLLGVLRTLFKWKKQIIYVCLIAGVGSIIISLLLPVYYQATTVFLAASPDQAKPELLFGSGTLEGEYYGNENDIDRILTIAESAELFNFLIDTFSLYQHYDIDSSANRAQYRVKQKLANLYEVTKTKRDAIELSVEDKDKVFATNMANTARRKINQILQKLIKESQLKTMSTYQENIENKDSLINVTGDSLVTLRSRYGIYNTDAQTETLTAQFDQSEATLIRNRTRLDFFKSERGVPRDTIVKVEALVKGLEKEVEKLSQKITLFNDGMAKVAIYEKQYAEANQSLSEDKERAKQLKAAYNSNIPAVLLVESAQTPDIKSRPKRMFVVLGACMVVFFFAVIGVLILENYRDVNWREIYHGK